MFAFWSAIGPFQTEIKFESISDLQLVTNCDNFPFYGSLSQATLQIALQEI